MAVETVAFTVVGMILSMLLLFVFIRQLEAVFFYGVLVGPGIGNAIVGAIFNAVQGDMAAAAESFKFLPFFLAAIDETFFAETPSEVMVAVGAIILFMWFYVFLHFTTRKFGVWFLPIILPLMYVAGLSFVNLRLLLAQTYPELTWLVMEFVGIPALILATMPLFLVAFLYARRKGHQIQVPMWSRLELQPKGMG